MLQFKKIGAGFLCGVFVVAHMAAIAGLLGMPEAFHRGGTYTGGWSEEYKIDRRLLDDKLIWTVPEWDGVGAGQTRLLYKDYKSVHGKTYVPRIQGPAPSCVGQSTAAAVDFLAAVEIRAGDPERVPPASADASVIYGLSRIEIGGVGPGGGGSHNLWAAQALTEYGVVARLNYPLLGYDLREPSPSRCVQFGSAGIPTGLEMIARLHPVKDYISIDYYEECRDAIYMGCPVVVGSSQGFGEGRLTRDKDGFLNPPRRAFFPSVWNHSMVIIGVSDEGRRGCLVLNSWGDSWVNGPKRFGDEPEGSFWVDWEVIERMVQQGDSFALRGFRGYPNYRLWRP